MVLCDKCQGVGGWLIPAIDINETRTVSRVGQDLLPSQSYLHYKSSTDLKASASAGCLFCSHILHYFHARGSHRGWYETEIEAIVEPRLGSTTWVERIEELSESGNSTQIILHKGVSKLHFGCGDIGSGGENVSNGLDIYISPGTNMMPFTRHDSFADLSTLKEILLYILSHACVKDTTRVLILWRVLPLGLQKTG